MTAEQGFAMWCATMLVTGHREHECPGCASFYVESQVVDHLRDRRGWRRARWPGKQKYADWRRTAYAHASTRWGQR